MTTKSEILGFEIDCSAKILNMMTRNQKVQ